MDLESLNVRKPKTGWPDFVEYPENEAERRLALAWLKREETAAWVELGRALGTLVVVSAPVWIPVVACAWLAWRLR